VVRAVRRCQVAKPHCQDGAEACEPAVADSLVEQAIRIMRLATIPLGFECAEEITEMPMEEAGDDPSEEVVPQTEEPSYYQHHYEGCPYMGGCPHSHGTLEQSPVQVPSCDEKPNPKKPKKGDGYWDRLLNRTSERRFFNPPFNDTMEFRPSDAGNYPVLKVGPF
jgi:hypothetical protein